MVRASNLVCGLLWGCLLLASDLKAESLRIIAESWPPYAYELDGQAVGMDVELTRQILSQLGYTPSFEFYPWTRALAMIRNGQADAILDITKGEMNEREHYLHFPDTYLSTSNSTLFFRRDHPFSYEGLPSLRGKRVAVVRGYNYSPDFFSAPYFIRDQGNGHEQNLKKLHRGRVDLALLNTAVALYWARKMRIETDVDFDPTVLSGGKLYIAFAFRPKLAELSAQFGPALRQFKQGQSYRNLLLRYGLTPEQMRAKQ